MHNTIIHALGWPRKIWARWRHKASSSFVMSLSVSYRRVQGSCWGRNQADATVCGHGCPMLGMSAEPLQKLHGGQKPLGAMHKELFATGGKPNRRPWHASASERYSCSCHWLLRSACASEECVIAMFAPASSTGCSDVDTAGAEAIGLR